MTNEIRKNGNQQKEFSLESKVRTDGEFRSGLAARFKELDRISALAHENPTCLGQYQDVLREFVGYCNFNLVFLTPHFWPRYPKGQPLSYANFPFAWQMFELQVGGFRVFRASRQISKSTSFCCRQLLNARFLPAFKSIYIVPRHQQLKTYQNKMREMEQQMRGFTGRRERDQRKNLGYKEFANGSSIEMVHVLTAASLVRGKSADEILYDEVQDFDPDLELEVAQIQSASPQPVTVYAGTSLTTDTMLEKKWLESSQGLWLMRCGCGHENIPLPEHGVLEMIQPRGPACRKCGRPLNVRAGHFVHSYPHLLNLQRIGFHIPQIIVPAVVEHPARWAKIYELLVKQGGDRKFLQEILGIAVEEGEREITLNHLMAICTLGSDRQALLRKAQERGYQFVVSGCDWGGSDYLPAQHVKVSTTVHVIVGIRPASGEFDILHMRRYHGMGYDDIAGDIIKNHLLYGGYALASDFGVGAVYNSKLREKIPLARHLVFNYVGPASELIDKPKGPHMVNQWSLNKTESISLTYEAVRRKRIRCYAWEYSGEYLTDFLNLFRAPGEASNGGASTFIYRAHPSKPNDTLQATNYAYMLGKILLGEPMFADLSLKSYLENSLSSDFAYLQGDDGGAFSA